MPGFRHFLNRPVRLAGAGKRRMTPADTMVMMISRMLV
jgi:hypothetical protein